MAATKRKHRKGDIKSRDGLGTDEAQPDFDREQDTKAGIILDDWQQEALKEEGNLLLCTGRQVGKTYIMSRKASEYLIKHQNSKIICCSLTEDQAKLIIVMTLDYLEKNYNSLIAKGAKKPTQNKITLKNGSSMIARPVGNTGDAVRGFTGDILILDEASRFNEFIFTSAKPTLLTTAGKIWICSTPFGKQGYFYDCYLNKNNRFKVIETNSWDVVNTRPISAIWTEKKRVEAIKFLEDERKDMTELQFAQEYLGKFVEDLTQLFSDELIRKCCILKRPDFRPQKEYYLGVDISRLGKDLNSFEILQKIDDKNIMQVENITTKKKFTTETFDRIKELDLRYSFTRIGIDSSGVGAGVYDFLMREPIIRGKVISLDNATRIVSYRDDKQARLLKEHMYMELLAMMEKDIIKLLDDPDIFNALKSIQYEYNTTPTQKVTMKIHGKDSHIVEGIIRATHLVNQSKTAFIGYI